ncbi:MAG: hypothetical protein K8F91_11630 [Candidatus Obscuribacterales bacterium]|nr:hypothetical protein [Candidatus Obscuribacterales bacterium]
MRSFKHLKYLLAGRPETDPKTLRRLSRSKSLKIRQRVAENSSCPNDVLSSLSNDSNSEVKIAVAGNPKTNKLILYILSWCDDSDVRFWIASNTGSPREIISMLTKDENPFVADRAKRTFRKMEPREFKTRTGQTALRSTAVLQLA